MYELVDLAYKYGTDKGKGHGFAYAYQNYLEPIRCDARNILEIGIHEGKSHFMWHEYFPEAAIYGWDIEDKKGLEEGYPRFKTSIVDQSNRKAMYDWVREHPVSFDLIIDDGGHTMEQQQTTIGFMWKYLKEGGIYICEDLHTSLKHNLLEFAGGRCREDFSNSSLEIFKRLQKKKPILSEYMRFEERNHLEHTIAHCKIHDILGDERHITCVLIKAK